MESSDLIPTQIRGETTAWIRFLDLFSKKWRKKQKYPSAQSVAVESLSDIQARPAWTVRE